MMRVDKNKIFISKPGKRMKRTVIALLFGFLTVAAHAYVDEGPDAVQFPQHGRVYEIDTAMLCNSTDLIHQLNWSRDPAFYEGLRKDGVCIEVYAGSPEEKNVHTRVRFDGAITKGEETFYQVYVLDMHREYWANLEGNLYPDGTLAAYRALLNRNTPIGPDGKFLK